MRPPPTPSHQGGEIRGINLVKMLAEHNPRRNQAVQMRHTSETKAPKYRNSNVIYLENIRNIANLIRSDIFVAA